MNTLYKGYIKTKGKKAIEAFKDRTKYRTYDEVKNLEGFGGVLADDTILIDIDDAEQSEILMSIVEEYQLDCRVYCTSRGRHFLFKNHSITRNRTHDLKTVHFSGACMGRFLVLPPLDLVGLHGTQK